MKINPVRRVILVCLACCCAALAAQPSTPDTAPELSREIERLLGQESLSVEGAPILDQDVVLHVYRDNAFEPNWTSAELIRQLVTLIEDAPDQGLIPTDYNIDLLRPILDRQQNDPAATLSAGEDVLLTDSLLLYTYHRRLGKIKPSSQDPDINFKRLTFRNEPPSEVLHAALEASSLQLFIDTVAPPGPFYKGLQQWLVRFRQIAASGGWPRIPIGPTMRLGDDSPRVVYVRKRLALTGDLPQGADIHSTVFDEPLEEAVTTFQARHALQNDGIVGQRTIVAMNVPVEQRIDQIRASLERIRWVNQEAVQTFVAVNIASFRAFLFRDGEMEWSTRAAVGRDYRQTPIFRGDIQYIEFNPTWTIPPTILRKDTLPEIKNDPNYLATKSIKVIDSNGKRVDPSTVDWSQYTRSIPYTLVQDPGPENALGVVKFIFPNKHSVFLHDTPHRELFDRPERAFSSGCIRIQDPLELAALLLSDGRFTPSDIQAIVDSHQTQRIYLEKPVPVIITYLTASLDDDGMILFFRDIYDKDRKVLEALNAPLAHQPPDTGNDSI